MSRSILRIFPTLPPLLNTFCLASILLTLAGILARFVAAHLLHLPQYPYGFYVTRADGLDLMSFYIRFQHIHSPDFFSPDWGPAYAYPAAVAPLYWLLTRVRYAQIPFVLLGGASTLVLAWHFSRALKRRGASKRDARWFVVITGACSYPFYFEFARGNMEIFMWLLTAIAVYAILNDRPWLGAVLLGFAIAMKLYPFVLLALFFSRRRYLPILLSIAVAVAWSIAALWFLCPQMSFAQHAINASLASFRTIYAVPYRPIFSGVDHSLYALIKRILGPQPWSRYDHILRVYTWLTAIAGLLLYFLRIRILPAINQVLCLTIAFILLPPVSFDYTLIHLYVPFAMLVLTLVRLHQPDMPPSTHPYPNATPHATINPAPPRSLALIMASFILLLGQLGEIILSGDRLGAQIKAVVLIVLFYLGLLIPLSSEWDQSVRQSNLLSKG